MAILEEYLNRDDLAKELGCSPRTVCRYENEPDGLPSTRIGGRVLYHLASVRSWLSRRERKPNPRRRAA